MFADLTWFFPVTNTFLWLFWHHIQMHNQYFLLDVSWNCFSLLSPPPPLSTCLISCAGSNTTVLRSGCIKMLRQIHTSMQMHNETQPVLEQATSEPQLQPQPQTQAHMCSRAAVWSPHQLEECSLLLLTRLLELHDLQASAFLSLLKNKVRQPQHQIQKESTIMHVLLMFKNSDVCLLERTTSPGSARGVWI